MDSRQNLKSTAQYSTQGPRFNNQFSVNQTRTWNPLAGYLPAIAESRESNYFQPTQLRKQNFLTQPLHQQGDLGHRSYQQDQRPKLLNQYQSVEAYIQPQFLPSYPSAKVPINSYGKPLQQGFPESFNYQASRPSPVIPPAGLHQPKPQSPKSQQLSGARLMQAPNMNVNTGPGYVPPSVGYSSPPQHVMVPDNSQHQSYSQLSSSPYAVPSPYSTSPYSTSPYSPVADKIYSNSPAPVNYVQKTNSDSHIQAALDNLSYNHKAEYQGQASYPLRQDQYGSSLPKDADIQPYSVKYDTGVIHQYPVPDYVNPPPDYTEVQQSYYGKNERPDYRSDVSHSYLPEPNQNTPQILPPIYDPHSVERQHQVSYQVSSNQELNMQNNQYSQQMLSHLTAKQGHSLMPNLASPPLNQGQVVDPPAYLSYRSTEADSPQGSPLPVQQASPNVFTPPQATPPLPRRQRPDPKISNEVYSVDSPSNQLLFQDLTLNSPRPRSVTVDMEPPVLPPRSPALKPKSQNSIQEQTIYNLPPPIQQIPSNYQTVLQTTQMTQQQLQQQQQHQLQQQSQQQPNLQQPVNQRLRSGTVEMLDSGPVIHHKQDPPREVKTSMPPPAPVAAKYTPQLSLPAQRGRAGTVEMVDTSSIPDRRIRSGTVEMSETCQQPINHIAVVEYGALPAKRSGEIAERSSLGNVKAGNDDYNANRLQTSYSNTSSASGSMPVQRNNVSSQHRSTDQLHSQKTAANTQQVLSHSANQRNVTQPLRQYTGSQLANNQSLQYCQQPNNQQIANQNVPFRGGADTVSAVSCSQNLIPSPSGYRQAVVSSVKVAASHQANMKNGDSELKYTLSPANNQKTVSVTPPKYSEANDGRRNQSLPVKRQTNENAAVQDLEQQQKIMQQQYVQRVRQAQLQQQLREIQNEYEANLQLEQDIAQEFLREQKDMSAYYALPPYYQTTPSQHVRPHYYDPAVGSNPAALNQQIPQQLPPRMMNAQKDAPVFPVTNIPINQVPYQQRMPAQQRPAQPIVIMPGGGSFSNPGQFVPTSMPISRKDPRHTQDGGHNVHDRPTVSKQQTPFQKLRKIAEDISSFVDDVVKFKGKKGDHEYKYLEEMLTQQLLYLDKVAASANDDLRNARKALVKEVQELLEILERRSTQKSDP